MSTETTAPSNQGSDLPPAEIQDATLHIPFPDSFIYSNCAAFSISQMDIRISFAEAMPDRTAKARVGIVMPPEHAALLGMALIQQVHIYERNFGPIRNAQWQSQKDEAIKTLLDAGMIHANPEASLAIGPHDPPRTTSPASAHDEVTKVEG
jgi:Protein of unknown function (DUF3467)